MCVCVSKIQHRFEPATIGLVFRHYCAVHIRRTEDLDAAVHLTMPFLTHQSKRNIFVVRSTKKINTSSSKP